MKKGASNYAPFFLENNGADDGIRTRDTQLGKLMLFRLSYIRNYTLYIITK